MSRRVRVLLIGGSGQLGRELLRALPVGDVVAPTHAELDLRDAAAIARCVGAAGADVVVNAAADNRVDAAETDPTDAEAINADAVGLLARAAAGARASRPTASA